MPKSMKKPYFRYRQLIEDAPALEAILNDYKTDFDAESLKMMRSKLGLQIEKDADRTLIQDLEDALQMTETDMTIFFRNLSDFSSEAPLKGTSIVGDSFYVIDQLTGVVKEKWNAWFIDYVKRLKEESLSDAERKKCMNAVNPKYVLRNYMSQLAIDDADEGNYQLIDELYQLLKKPYDEQPEHEKWFAKRPKWARNKVGCSMLSCSS